MGAYASLGRCPNEECSRVVWTASLAALLFAVVAPNPWLAGLIAMLGVSLWRTPVPREELERVLYPTFLWVGLYVALSPHITLDLVPLILAVMLAIGCFEGLWCIYSLCQKDETYSHLWQPFGYFRLRLAEYGFYHYLSCGLGNPNHALAVSGITTAAGVGLVMLGHWIAAPLTLLPACVLGSHLWRRTPDSKPSGALIYVYVLAVGAVAWRGGWMAWTSGVVVAASALTFIWQRHPDWYSLRTDYWLFAWQGHRNAPWHAKVFGFGLSAWLRRMIEGCPFASLATNPHSEWVAMLVESGWVGVVALAGYVLTSAWMLVHDGPLGFAVLLVGAMVLACSFVSSPWHRYMEIGVMDPKTKQINVVGQGCPALNVLSFATVLCIEAVTKAV